MLLHDGAGFGAGLCCAPAQAVPWFPGIRKEIPCRKVRLPQLINVLAGLPDERNAKYLDSFFYDH